MPQPVAPCSDSFATTGPSTAWLPTHAMLPRAAAATTTQSHVRERNSCQPSASSRRKVECSRLARMRVRIRARNAALAKYVPASNAMAHPEPMAATIPPPTAAPMIVVAVWHSRSTAFAC